jgi:hypothetical protein
MQRHHVIRSLILAALAAGAARAGTAQTLETETARLLPRGWWKIGNAYEFQTSSEGREAAVPFIVEYGVTGRLELVVEPVPYAAIRPNRGRRARGAGDVEVTLTWLLRHESGGTPALALAAEVKLPTARDTLIGTRRTDYTGYLIASRRFGRLDTHANLAYTVVGRPAGARVNNIIYAAVAGVYRPNARTELFGEIFGNTAASAEAESGTGPGGTTVTAEVAGGEVVGTLGAGRYVVPNLLLYGAVSYDNNRALLLRPGLTFRFR